MTTDEEVPDDMDLQEDEEPELPEDQEQTKQPIEEFEAMQADH